MKSSQPPEAENESEVTTRVGSMTVASVYLLAVIASFGFWAAQEIKRKMPKLPSGPGL